jgi:hypothetical protein
MFGQFIKQIRERQRLGLRDFLSGDGYDPSNWTKIEREVPPGARRGNPSHLGQTTRSQARLGRLAQVFGLAAVDSGRIPDYVLKDEKLVAQLPVFFRTISGQKPSREDREKLMVLIQNAG